MFGKIKVLLSVIISYTISLDDSEEVDNGSASELLVDTNESVSQEKSSSPKTSALLHVIPENETVGQDDVFRTNIKICLKPV